jgi:hypothetical protein
VKSWLVSLLGYPLIVRDEEEKDLQLAVKSFRLSLTKLFNTPSEDIGRCHLRFWNLGALCLANAVQDIRIRDPLLPDNGVMVPPIR